MMKEKARVMVLKVWSRFWSWEGDEGEKEDDVGGQTVNS